MLLRENSSSCALQLRIDFTIISYWILLNFARMSGIVEGGGGAHVYLGIDKAIFSHTDLMYLDTSEVDSLVRREAKISVD